MKRPHWSRTISHQVDDKVNEHEFSSINNLLTTTDTLMCENDFQIKPTEKGTCEQVEDSINQFQSSDIVDGTKMEYQQGGNALSVLPTVSDGLNLPILTQSSSTMSDMVLPCQQSLMLHLQCHPLNFKIMMQFHS